MGQYHKVYNLDKKEYIHAHRIDCGLKLREQYGFEKSTADALFVLLAVSNGKGGGDIHPNHPRIGSWGGDRIVVVGDYYEEEDLPSIKDEDFSQYTDISSEVNELFEIMY